ncbi:UBX domain-containing protein 7 [Chamberlinius hualienensis]
MSTPRDKKKNIHQFCSITGTDKETAKKILEACNHNIEMAINMHVEAQEVEERNEQSKSSGASSSKSPEVRPPIPPTRGILVDNVVTAGIRVRNRISKSVFDGFRNFEAEAREQEMRIQGGSAASSQKLKTLEDLFRPPLDIMHRGSFDSARELGQGTNKWLMVNIQNVQEFTCQVLNRDVWSNPAVKNIIKENFIFWQIYHDSEEGVRYMQFYKVVEWPYVAIIDPRTGENVVSWNKIEAASFCELVSDFITRNPSLDGSESDLRPTKKPRTDSIIDASEESQLEAALKASLVETSCALPDSTQSTNKWETSSFGLSDEEDDELEAFDADDSDESQLTSSSSNTTMKEPESKTPPPPQIPPSTTTSVCSWKDYLGLDEDSKSDIVFRFPDGTKDQLSLPSSSKLKAIFLYAESKGFNQESFEMVTNFPKRKLSTLDDTMTLKEAGLLPQETVFLQAR